MFLRLLVFMVLMFLLPISGGVFAQETGEKTQFASQLPQQITIGFTPGDDPEKLKSGAQKMATLKRSRSCC